jgi:hypothetical protein
MRWSATLTGSGREHLQAGGRVGKLVKVAALVWVVWCAWLYFRDNIWTTVKPG